MSEIDIIINALHRILLNTKYENKIVKQRFNNYLNYLNNNLFNMQHSDYEQSSITQIAGVFAMKIKDELKLKNSDERNKILNDIVISDKIMLKLYKIESKKSVTLSLFYNILQLLLNMKDKLDKDKKNISENFFYNYIYMFYK